MNRKKTNNFISLESIYDDSVIWVEKFNDEGLRNFYSKFMKLEADDTVSIIPIFISSYGGYVYTAFAMRDIIKSSPKPVATIALGKAMSCGAILLASGTPGYRFASPDTHMLIHEVSSGVVGKTSEIKQETKYIDELNKRLFKRLAIDTGKSLKAFQKYMHKIKNNDWVLSARQSKEWGLVDHIMIPRLHDQPSMRMLTTVRPFSETLSKKSRKKRVKKS